MIVRFLMALFSLCAAVFSYGVGAGMAMIIVLWLIDKIGKKR